MTEGIISEIESYGIDLERFQAAFGHADNWGALVHSFEYVTVLSVVEKHWVKAEQAKETA